MTPKPSGQRIKAKMVDAAEEALRRTAQDVLDASKKDVPIDDGELLASAKVTVVRVGDALEAKVEYTADHSASQEIGGRSRIGRDKAKQGGFIRFKNHPGGGKDHFLSDALKSGVRKYRANMKKVIREETGAK